MSKQPAVHIATQHGKFVALCGASVKASTTNPLEATCKSCIRWHLDKANKAAFDSVRETQAVHNVSILR